MSNIDIQYTVYKNILVFANKYRKYNITQTLNIDEFQKQMQFIQYLIMSGKDESGTPVYILLITIADNITIKKKDFSKYISTIKKDEKCTLIFIINNIKEKSITKYRNLIQRENPNYETYIYNFDMFIVVIPEQNQVAIEYKILSEEEVKQVEKDLRCPKTELPTRHVSQIPYDPPLVWHNARPGNVVKIVDLIESTGLCVKYVRVID